MRARSCESRQSDAKRGDTEIVVWGVCVPGAPRWNEAVGVRKGGGEGRRMSGEGPPGYAGCQGEPAPARRASSQCFSQDLQDARPPNPNAWPAPFGEDAPFKVSGRRCSVCHQSSVSGKATLISCCCVMSSSSGRNTESRRGAAPAAGFSGASPLLRDPHCHHYPSRRLPRQTAEISV